MAAAIKVVEENPNDVTGGGGCLCSQTPNSDTGGPFVVFIGETEMDSIISPTPVLCAGCVAEASHLLEQYELDGGVEAEVAEL